MTRKELKGKKFLHRLLKIQLQIDEKKDELSYWVRQAASCEEGSALSDDIDRRTEELRALIMTMNARELRHFFSLRCCNRAQWEIRQMADDMLRLCRKAAPEIFRSAGPGCVSGKCPELKSCGSPRQEREWDA